MIVRRWVWFIPIAPPIRAFIAAISRSILDEVPFIIKTMMDKGASFCQVDKIKQDIHEMEVITEGYHKWQGAMPIFNNRDISNNILMKFIGIEKLNQRDILDISIILEPKAWAKKYLIEASVSWLEFDSIIKGINDNRFNSIPTHINSQLELDMTISVLNSIVNLHKKLNGVYFIRIWRSWTAQFKLEA